MSAPDGFMLAIDIVSARLPLDATEDTRDDIAWAMVGLGLFVVGAVDRMPGARRC